MNEQQTHRWKEPPSDDATPVGKVLCGKRFHSRRCLRRVANVWETADGLIWCSDTVDLDIPVDMRTLSRGVNATGQCKDHGLRKTPVRHVVMKVATRKGKVATILA